MVSGVYRIPNGGKRMGTAKIMGVVLLVVGVLLLFFGWQSSESVGDQISETLTGRFTDETMWYLIGGAAAVVAGAFLALVKR
jgi:drug/metabolite transporter (DMT)-like permease